MTDHQIINPLSTGTDYQTLAARFRPIFARIAAGAVEREQSRVNVGRVSYLWRMHLHGLSEMEAVYRDEDFWAQQYDELSNESAPDRQRETQPAFVEMHVL